jgi:hypothetical protein
MLGFLIKNVVWDFITAHISQFPFFCFSYFKAYPEQQAEGALIGFAFSVQVQIPLEQEG